jgi:hypothetical protein
MLGPKKDKTIAFIFMQDHIVPIKDEPSEVRFNLDVVEASYLVEILIDDMMGEGDYWK